jgi:hypothetical protein
MLAVAYGQNVHPNENSGKKVSPATANATILAGKDTDPAPLQSSPANAEDAQLSTLLKAAGSQYQPIQPAEVANTKARLLESLAALDAYLASSSEAAGWKNYLKWNQLSAQLAHGVQPDASQLRDVLKQYRDKYPGLELPWFTNVRYWLNAYANGVAALASPDVKQYQAQLETIGRALDASQRGQPVASKDLGRAVGALQRTGQARGLVAALRRRFSRPNVLVCASARLVTTGIARPVDDTRPLQDTIMGTYITGTGHTLGQVTGQLLSDPHHAAMATTMTGTASSTTVGYNGPVVIYASAQTGLWAQKMLYFDALGLHTQPAAANAMSSSCVTGVGTNRGGLIGRIIEKAAWKRIPEKKPLSDRISSEHARAKLATQMDLQADTLIDRANRLYGARLRNPLLRQEAFPRQLDISSDPTGLRITATQSSDEHLGAPGPPPQLAKQGEIYVQLHESFVNNLAADMLGGRTLTREEVEQGAIDTFGSLPPSMKQDQEEDSAPWAIEFAGEDPVTMAFDNDEAVITIRGQHYKSGGRTFQAMTVSARYKLVSTPNGMRADRQGELSVYPPAVGPGKAMGVREKVVEKMLRKRFNKIFEPQVVFHGLKLPGNFAKLGSLVAHNFKADGGWLLVAWDEGGTSEK